MKIHSEPLKKGYLLYWSLRSFRRTKRNSKVGRQPNMSLKEAAI